MLTILDMNAEFAKLKMLRGRTPETPEAKRQGAFARLAPYRDNVINAAKFSAKAPGSVIPMAMISCRSSTAP